MDAYKAPESTVEIETIEVKPIKGIVLSLLVATVLMVILSTILGIVFAITQGINPEIEDALETALANDVQFLAIDMLMSFLIMVLSGRMLAGYVPGSEKRYGMVFTVIALILYIIPMVLTGSFSIYPFWYSAISIGTLPVAIYIGIKLKTII